MNVLFVSIAWPVKGERNLYSDLMDEFSLNGHNVYVLCADEKIEITSCEVEKGLNILRVNTSRIRKAGKLKKAFAFLSLGSRLKNQFCSHWSRIKFDLIISNSPPVSLSWLLRGLKKKLNAPLYYLLKDIWPDGPADLRLIRKNGLIYRYFRFHEKRIYEIADYIGCMSPENVNYILRRNSFISAAKVEVCPNTITPRSLKLREERNAIRKKHDIPVDSTVFVFSGNIGKAHGLDFYLNAIEKLKDYTEAYFLIGGGGVYFNYVVKETNRRKLTNLGTYTRLPPDDFDQLLLSSDVGVILLSSHYTVPQFPSRMLAYLEAGKPILCSVSYSTDIGSVIEDAKCGISTTHGDIDAFINAVKYFCDGRNSDSILKMKENSLALLDERYTSAASYNIITSHFQKDCI